MLHPQAQALIDLLVAHGLPPTHTLSPAEARAFYRERRALTQPTPPDVAEVRALRLPGPGGDIAARAFRPLGAQPQTVLPALVYFHGGGWVIGDLDTHDTLCRELANASGCAVVSVDYRLAPEHPFPAAFDDALAATRWVSSHAAELGADPTRLAVGGDSAGGNLAAAVALALCGSDYRLIAQWLVYPVVDFDTSRPSYSAMAAVAGLPRSRMEDYSALYCPRPEDRAQERAAPLRAASLAGLPPAFIGVAENDILRDEGAAFRAALEAAGVQVAFDPGLGLAHGYMLAADRCAPARAARDAGFRWLADRNAQALAGG